MHSCLQEFFLGKLIHLLLVCAQEIICVFLAHAESSYKDWLHVYVKVFDTAFVGGFDLCGDFWGQVAHAFVDEVLHARFLLETGIVFHFHEESFFRLIAHFVDPNLECPHRCNHFDRPFRPCYTKVLCTFSEFVAIFFSDMAQQLVYMRSYTIKRFLFQYLDILLYALLSFLLKRSQLRVKALVQCFK